MVAAANGASRLKGKENSFATARECVCVCACLARELVLCAYSVITEYYS